MGRLSGKKRMIMSREDNGNGYGRKTPVEEYHGAGGGDDDACDGYQDESNVRHIERTRRTGHMRPCNRRATWGKPHPLVNVGALSGNQKEVSISRPTRRGGRNLYANISATRASQPERPLDAMPLTAETPPRNRRMPGQVIG